MKVWIDAANSPHPPLFAPITRQLERDGHEVIVTARDHAQTLELAREVWPEVEAFGEESPGGRLAKAAALAGRIRALRSWARGRRPDVALSHNSYAQIVAARSLRIPAVTAMDFEHQPSNHLAFRLAKVVLVPEAFPVEAARRQGASATKLRRYPGLKESLYLGDFEPSRRALEELGLTPGESILVVARTPPSRALYHRQENRLFLDCLEALGREDEVACVVLARHPEQRAELEQIGGWDAGRPRSCRRRALLDPRCGPVPGRGRHDDPRGGADGRAHRQRLRGGDPRGGRSAGQRRAAGTHRRRLGAASDRSPGIGAAVSTGAARRVRRDDFVFRARRRGRGRC